MSSRSRETGTCERTRADERWRGEDASQTQGDDECLGVQRRRCQPAKVTRTEREENKDAREIREKGRRGGSVYPLSCRANAKNRKRVGVIVIDQEDELQHGGLVRHQTVGRSEGESTRARRGE